MSVFCPDRLFEPDTISPIHNQLSSPAGTTNLTAAWQLSIDLIRSQSVGGKQVHGMDFAWICA